MVCCLNYQKDQILIDENVHQNKLFGILKEHSEWAEILGVKTVGNINATIDNGEISDIIKISEALQEKKIAQIADQIHSKSDVKFVLISGPSSSGKTSFCKRLDIQLRVLGYKPINISLDDYFVDRELTPRDENGDYDFECLEAIDIQQFNRDMIDLLDGKEVELPKFNFSLGKGFPSGKKIKAYPNTIFLIEGIHGLNPKLSQLIEDKFKFKIYVSALTTILLDRHNRISTTDNRLMRRLVRDYYYRGYSAYATLSRWESVTRGEQKNIFPFQENADVMFNSSLLYEIGVLKPHLTKILVDVPENVEEYAEAKRLLKLLTYFKEIPEKEIPPTSIIREFFGGSSFKY
jgi:uridine kinase